MRPVDEQTFVELRPSLFGFAYRLLGSVADAEDVVQDAYLRWTRVPTDTVDNPRAYLTSVVVRLGVDRLRSARARRERYVGVWLPEPLVVDEHDAAADVELADSLSLAFLVLLEELRPLERAAYLLREVFGYDYPELARILDRSEPACRQLVSRARQHVEARRQRFDADQRQARELARRFLVACAGGDVGQLMSLLSEDAVAWTDGGGKAKAARRAIIGAGKVARFLAAITPTLPPDARFSEVLVNGQPGVVVEEPGRGVTNVVAVEVRDGRVVGVQLVNNPDKLRHLQGRFRPLP